MRRPGASCTAAILVSPLAGLYSGCAWLLQDSVLLVNMALGLYLALATEFAGVYSPKDWIVAAQAVDNIPKVASIQNAYRWAGRPSCSKKGSSIFRQSAYCQMEVPIKMLTYILLRL